MSLSRSTPITKQTLERKFPDLFILDDKESTTHQLNVNDYDETSIDTSLAHWNDAEPETYATFSSALDRAVNYMAQFRADNIVKDAEEIKNALLLPIEDINDDDDANNTSEDSKDEVRNIQLFLVHFLIHDIALFSDYLL